METLGVALVAITVPGASNVNDRLDDDNAIEIGLDIHGEAGMQQSVLLIAGGTGTKILATIKDYGRENETGKMIPMFDAGDDVCMLVHNLGGASNFEMSILANPAVKIMEREYRCKVSRLLVGGFMTSFNMHGTSLTVLELTGAPATLVECLDASTTAGPSVDDARCFIGRSRQSNGL